MKNVYGYIRVSTIRQGDGVSLDVQKEAIKRYAQQNDLNIIRWFEELFSAAKIGRPLFSEMMSLLKRRKADGVIIYKIDRSARNLEDWTAVTGIIDRFPDVDVHFAHEQIDLRTRGGRLSGDIQAVSAADFSRNNRQQTINGLYGRIAQGIFPFQAPVGYLNNGKGKLKTIDPIQAPLVKLAFDLYLQGKWNIPSLTVHMNKLGLKSIRGGNVHHNGMWGILRNPFYMGLMEVKGEWYPAKHEPIIKPSFFNKVKSMMEGKLHQKVQVHDFIYRKLIKCSQCNRTLTGEVQKGNIYYRCHTTQCVTKSFRENFITEKITTSFCSVQLLPEEYAVIKDLMIDSEHETISKIKALGVALNLQKNQLDKKIERLTDCYIDGGLDRETYEDRKAKILLEMKIKQEAEIEILQHKSSTVNQAKEFFELINNLVESFNSAILHEKHKIIQIVSSNFSATGKNIEFAMQSPFLELSNRYSKLNGAHLRDTLRIKDGKSLQSVHSPSLSREQLESLLDQVIASFSQAPFLAESLDSLTRISQRVQQSHEGQKTFEGRVRGIVESGSKEVHSGNFAHPRPDGREDGAGDPRGGGQFP